MNNLEKTQLELEKNFQELKYSYDQLKKSYEQDIIVRNKAEEDLLQRTALLSAFNQYSIELAEQENDKIQQYIVRSFKSLFNVRGVWISSYDEKRCELVIDTSTASEEENSKIIKFLGSALRGFRISVDEATYKIMMERGDMIFSSLHDISFGQVPQLAGVAIEKIFDVGWFQGVALIDKGKLFGTLVIAGFRGQDQLQRDIVKIFAELTSNIIRRKQTERKLQTSEDKFRKAFITSPDSININRLDSGMYVSVNHGFTKISGYSEDEVVGKTSLELNIWHDLSDRDRLIKELREKGEVNNLESRFKMKNGSIINGIMSAALIDLDGVQHILSITRDITDRKQAEDEVNKLNARLEERVNERTSQLEAANTELQAFAYSVSHDLRAPLRAIDGFSKFLLEDYSGKLDSEGQRLLGLIRGNTKKMDKLITDILALSRVTRSEHKKSKIDMTKMALSMFNEAASPETQERMEFIIEALPETYADPTYIKQVWINLISNAIKFSSLRRKPEIKIGGYPEDGFNVYFINDNGVGFNPEYAHKLFGVFQRLHKANEFEGTGVGLAIVQRIIQRHGGKVWAEGVEGKGATFYFSLPANGNSN